MERPRRTYVAVRIGGALARVEQIAQDSFDGNRSAALRTLLRLGLTAWERGAR